MATRTTPLQNHLLASLPETELQRWSSRLEWCWLDAGDVLYEAGSRISHAYFPTTAIISLVHLTENGDSTEIAVVGNDGIVGISLFMGGNSTSSSATVQSAGETFRIRASTIKEEFGRAPFSQLMLRYTHALITQMSQMAVCNRHHTLEQQLCRWLLLTLDRCEGNDIASTQELIANMLGVRREGVTLCALKLQQDGLIRYSRGRITVLDRKGLEQRACECYATVEKEYERLLAGSEQS